MTESESTSPRQRTVVSQWMIDTLHQHLTAISERDNEIARMRTECAREVIEVKLQAQKDAVGPALAALNEKLAGMNEIKEAMNDQQNNFPTKAEVNAKFETVAGKIEALTDKLGLQVALMEASKNKGAGAKDLWLVIFALITATSLIAKFWH